MTRSISRAITGGMVWCFRSRPMMIARKRVNSMAIILADTHAQGLSYGPDFDNLDDMPLMESELEVDHDSVWSEYDADPVSFPGEWNTDSRVCLQAQAPRPCTILAAVLGMHTSANG